MIARQVVDRTGNFSFNANQKTDLVPSAHCIFHGVAKPIGIVFRMENATRSGIEQHVQKTRILWPKSQADGFVARAADDLDHYGGMQRTVAPLRQNAAQYRHMADAISSRAEPTIASLQAKKNGELDAGLKQSEVAEIGWAALSHASEPAPPTH